MTVVKFKPRKKTAIGSSDRAALEAIDQALGAEFIRLAQLYGTYAVSTVAVRYIAECIQSARSRHRGPEDRWIGHISKILNDAMKSEP